MSIKINWQDPPPKNPSTHRKGTGKWQQVAQELKMNAGRWALVGENVDRSGAVHLRKYGCEARSLTAGKGYGPARADIYARWPEGGE